MFAKVALRPGLHHAPQGPLHATPARMREWVRKFRAMKADGIKVPCSWGHQPGAVPGGADDKASQQFFLSHFNAGYIDDLAFDAKTGNLTARLDVPGCEASPEGHLTHWARLPDGREVKAAIGEVSLGIRDWRDGKDRLWADSIIHLALTPLPVWSGQDGFRSLSTDGTRYVPLTVTLATTGGDMADNPFDDEPDSDEALPEIDANLPAAEPEAPAVDARFSEAVQVLRKLGLHLPPDTTMDNLVDRICVGGHALHNGTPDPEAPLPEDVAPMDETVDAERPVLMSLMTARTPVERALIADRQERRKRALLKRVDRLAQAGMPAHKAAEYRQRLGGYLLSLDSSGAPQPKRTEAELAIWAEALRALGGHQRAAYLSTVTEVATRPDERLPKPASEEEIERRARAVSVQ